MKTKLSTALQIALAAVVLVGCGGSANATKKRFSVVLMSSSDDGSPVVNTKFWLGKTALGVTNDRGLLEKSLTGAEGQSATLRVTCPEGYLSPEEATLLSLKEVRKVNQEGPATINVAVTCDRRQRDVVVVVRTNGVVSLPVDIGGKFMGATSADGTAHFHLPLDRGVRSLSVSLQTANQPSLRPQSPSRVFELDGNDAVLLVEQSFTSERASRTKRSAPAAYVPPKKRVPQRIDSARFHAL